MNTFYQVNKWISLSNQKISTKKIHIYRQRKPADASHLYKKRTYDPIISESVVTVQSKKGTRITMIGTFHMSQRSAEMVKLVLNNYLPNCVGVELCSERYVSLVNDFRGRNLLPALYYVKEVIASIFQILIPIYHPEISFPLLYHSLRGDMFGVDLYTAIEQTYLMNIESLYLIDLPIYKIKLRSENIFSYIKNYKMDLSVPPPIPDFAFSPWNIDDDYEASVKYYLSEVPISHIGCNDAQREQYMLHNIIAMMRDTKLHLVGKGIKNPPWGVVVVGLFHLNNLIEALKKRGFLEINPSDDQI